MSKPNFSTAGLAATTEMARFELNIIGRFIWNVFHERHIQAKQPKRWGGAMVTFASLTQIWPFYRHIKMRKSV